MNGSFVIAGESPDLKAARASGIVADAFLVAADHPDDQDAPYDDVASAFRRKALVEPLTERERQVLDLLAEGLSNKRIAERLGISDQTAKFHIASITGKLGAHNRTEAVRLAARRGLITL